MTHDTGNSLNRSWNHMTHCKVLVWPRSKLAQNSNPDQQTTYVSISMLELVMTE